MSFNIFITLTKALIRKNIGRFLILMCVCALGAGFYCGMNHVSVNMRDSYDRFHDDNNVYDYQVIADDGVTKDEANELGGVASKQIDSVVEYNLKKHVVRIQQSLDSDVNQLDLIEGHLPDNDTQCCALQSALNDAVLCIGDKISWNSREFEVVGIVNSPEYFNFSRVGYTTLADGFLENVLFVNESVFPEMMPYYCVYCKGDATNIDDKYTVLFPMDNDATSCYFSDVDSIESLSKIFPLIFYLIAVVVTITVVSRKINEDRRALGISLSLGIKRSVVLAQYLFFTILACLLGSVIGAILFTTFLPHIFMLEYSSIYNIKETAVNFDIQLICITVLITLCFVIVTTIFCLLKSVSVPPNQLLLPKVQKSVNRSLLERFKFWDKVSAIWKATLRSILCYPMRFFTSIINIACCTILFMCSLNLYFASSSMLQKQQTECTKDNYSVFLSSDNYDNVEEVIKNDIDVVDYSCVDDFIIQVYLNEDENQVCNGVWTADYDNLHKLRPMKSISSDETFVPKGDGVIITQRLSEIANINVGDCISASVDGNNFKDVRVDGIVENYIFNYVYFGDSAYKDFMQKDPSVTAIYVNTNSPYKLQDKLNDNEQVSIGKTLDSTYQYYQQLIDTIVYIAMVLIIITCIMSFTVLYSLTTIAVCERSGELSVLSMLGFKNLVVATHVHKDTLIHLLIGLPIGVILGQYLSVQVLMSIEGNSVLYDRAINPIMIYCSIGLVVLFVLISVLILAAQTNRIRLTENVKGQD